MILLILLFICHFLADYTHLSTKEMLDAKRFGKPLNPILNHASVHGLLMSFILLFFTSFEMILYLYLLQVSTHFTIDVLKGKMNVWFPKLQNPANKFRWYIFGFDQFLHQLVILFMWYLVTTI